MISQFADGFQPVLDVVVENAARLVRLPMTLQILALREANLVNCGAHTAVFIGSRRAEIRSTPYARWRALIDRQTSTFMICRTGSRMNFRAAMAASAAQDASVPLCTRRELRSGLILSPYEVRPFTESRSAAQKRLPTKRLSRSRTSGCSKNCRNAMQNCARPGASDRNGRSARHHQPLAHGCAAGPRRHRRERRKGLWDR